MTDGTTVAFSEELDPEALEAVVQQMWELMQDTQDMRDRDEL